MKTSLIFIMSFCCTASFAQSFSGQTNDIHLDFKNPSNAALPVIGWVYPRLENTATQNNKIEIEAEVRSEAPLRLISVVIGANSRGAAEKKLTLESGLLSYKVKQSLTLTDGMNEISIVVENQSGGRVSSSRFISVGRDWANRLDANRSDYALFFATNNYDDFSDLVNPIDDARAIEKLLKEKYGFKTEFVENPLYEDIYAKISEYNTRRFSPQDQLFIFFAGHGTFDDNLKEGFIAARNTLINDKGRTTYIPHGILRQRLDNIQCEHIFLVMDVCFGGTLDPTLAKSRASSPYDQLSDEEMIIKKLKAPTRKFLTSGSKEYVSDGIPGKHSPFAAQFIRALKETGGKGDRIMTINDLVGYFDRLASVPRFGKFSEHDDPTGDFLFVAKDN